MVTIRSEVFTMKKPEIIAGMVQGASHKRKGTPCQDSCRVMWLRDDSVVIAVADGHGSSASPFSKTGSAIAVNVFCKEIGALFSGYQNDLDLLMTYLNRNGDTKIAQQIRKEWCSRVITNHRKKKRTIEADPSGEIGSSAVFRQYGTTLLGLLVTPLFLFAFQIGDGDITFVDKTEVRPFVNASKILGTETHSLCKADAWKKANTAVYCCESVLSGNTMILLSTDGLSNSYRDEHEFMIACRDYYSRKEQYGTKAVADNLKEWLQETSEKGCGDDITVVMACFEQSNGVAENTAACNA